MPSKFDSTGLRMSMNFDAADRQTLLAVAEAEALPRNEIIRRAIRHYAETVGVKPARSLPKPRRRRAQS